MNLAARREAEKKDPALETHLQLLSEDERASVHERTLKILAETGLRVDTAKGRRALRSAGAEVDENTHIVRFPRALVEASLRLAPKEFTLGARRPGWDLPMNAGDCALMADGEGITVIDRKTGQHRPSTFQDWLEATRLLDALDEVGVYWDMVRRGEEDESIPVTISYWRHVFSNFSKHVQDSSPTAAHSPWLLEVLQVVFGDRETLRQKHPFSFLVCPQSPLVIESSTRMRIWSLPAGIFPSPSCPCL